MRNGIIFLTLIGLLTYETVTHNNDDKIINTLFNQNQAQHIAISTEKINNFKTTLDMVQQQHPVTISSELCPCDYCTLHDFSEINTSQEEFNDLYKDKNRKQGEKEWTILTYMAADNDLRRFAVRNIQQMATVGSNANVNIIVHLDIVNGNEKISEFYYIEKNKVTQLHVYSENILPMDSGNPQTLIEFCKHGINGFPARHYMLILWNHGTGAIDPQYGRFINPSLLFSFNPETNKLDLDRSIAYLDLISENISNLRGVCWDDTTGNYLPNPILAKTIEYICGQYLNGKKFDIIGFDACLMAGIEVGCLLKNCAQIVIGSEEVELGTGWNYSLLLMKFINSTPTSEEFARHIIASYQRAYANITNDYTLSAIRTSALTALEDNINHVSSLLIQGLSDNNPTIKTAISRAILQSRDPRACTHYEEPSYIDFGHFYENLEKNIDNIYTILPHALYSDLKRSLHARFALFQALVIAQVAGKNLIKSNGLSIYFPFNKIHFSYQTSDFFKYNMWGEFLKKYIIA